MIHKPSPFQGPKYEDPYYNPHSGQGLGGFINYMIRSPVILSISGTYGGAAFPPSTGVHEVLDSRDPP